MKLSDITGRIKYLLRRSRRRTGGQLVGVPQTLAFDTYRVFFDRIFEAHGYEVVHSPTSSADILSRGLDKSIDEVCLPLKLFFGHIDILMEMGVDAVFVPRLISIQKGFNFCPKFCVLPDLIAHSFPQLSIFSLELDLHHAKTADIKTHVFAQTKEMLVGLGRWDRDSTETMVSAWRIQHAKLSPVIQLDDRLPTVAVLSHPYVERDAFLHFHTTQLLAAQGVLTVHAPDPLPCGRPSSDLEADMYYETVARTARGIDYWLDNGIHGIVLLTFFACGPDSYAADTFMYRLKRRSIQIPVLRLTLDEHTALEGLATRLTTFADIVNARAKKQVDDAC